MKAKRTLFLGVIILGPLLYYSPGDMLDTFSIFRQAFASLHSIALESIKGPWGKPIVATAPRPLTARSSKDPIGPDVQATVNMRQQIAEGLSFSGSIALHYPQQLVVGQSNNQRNVIISDTVTGPGCSETLFPMGQSSIDVNVGGVAKAFTMKAPRQAPCHHQLNFIFSENYKAVSTKDVDILKPLVHVSLIDDTGTSVETVRQGDHLKLRFTAPTDWGGITGPQSYTATTDDNLSVKLNNNESCTLMAPKHSSCEIEEDIAPLASVRKHSFTIHMENNDTVSTDPDKLYFDVNQFIWEKISGGLHHTCALGSDHKIYCWGNNDVGQLGDGKSSPIEFSNVPVKVADNTNQGFINKNIIDISSGGNNSCAISRDHMIYCWGANAQGQLANGTTTPSPVPVKVHAHGNFKNENITSISTGHNGDRITGYACAISSGKAYCWGNNRFGQLGNNTKTDSPLPPEEVQDNGDFHNENIISISAGATHTCAITGNGHKAYCWGDNRDGELGNGTNTDSNLPVKVHAHGNFKNKNITSLSTGTFNACAISGDHIAYCWGYNEFGQLGNNTKTGSNLPVEVHDNGSFMNQGIRTLFSGFYNACAIDSKQQLYCWGSDGHGQLGDNHEVDLRKKPVKVSNNTSQGFINENMASPIISDTYACAMGSKDHQAYCWGSNSLGQLGCDTTTNSLLPVKVAEYKR